MRTKTESPCDLGTTVRVCRTEAGFSPKELADETHIREEDIREWERGQGAPPSHPALRALAHAMEVSTCELIQAAECD